MRDEETSFDEGERLYGQGDYDGAIAAYTCALSDEPEEGLYFQCRGQAYLRKGELDLAIADYTKALSLYDDDEDRAMAYLYRATAYISKTDYHNVMADSNAAIKLGHLLKDAYLARGIAYVNLGPMGQAFEDWKTAADYGSKGALQKLEQYGIKFTPMKKAKKKEKRNEE
jgi:tetratricopeptide (TPR) repeat protein